MAVKRLEHLLRLPTIPNGPAYRPDGTLQRRLADALARPDLSAQLVLGDDPVTLREQVGEDVERFGPQPLGLPGAMQGIETGVQGTVAKRVDHLLPPCVGARGTQALAVSRHLPRASPCRSPEFSGLGGEHVPWGPWRRGAAP